MDAFDGYRRVVDAGFLSSESYWGIGAPRFWRCTAVLSWRRGVVNTPLVDKDRERGCLAVRSLLLLILFKGNGLVMGRGNALMYAYLCCFDA